MATDLHRLGTDGSRDQCHFRSTGAGRQRDCERRISGTSAFGGVEASSGRREGKGEISTTRPGAEARERDDDADDDASRDNAGWHGAACPYFWVYAGG